MPERQLQRTDVETGGERRHGPEGTAPTFTALGEVSDEAAAYAVRKVAEVVAEIGDPVLLSRVKLGWSGDPAVERRARAEAAVDVDGTMVRARARGRTPHEAVDLVQQRLRDRLGHRADRERHRATARTPRPGTWRHSYLPTDRPPFFDRAPEARELVRHKSFEPDELTIEEAAWDMSLADNDFILFTDLATHADALLWQDDDQRLHYRALSLDASAADPDTVQRAAGVVSLVVDPAPASTSTLAEARERLDAGNEPFVAFVSTDEGRGNVLYRRYDGHYGLITPPTA